MQRLTGFRLHCGAASDFQLYHAIGSTVLDALLNNAAFIDFVGIVDEINTEKGKVKVLLSLFGRETPVELDFLQIEKL